MILTAGEPPQASETYDWESLVGEQIWFEHACRVAFFSHVLERKLQDGKMVMVKVHCEDRRSFDAVQSEPDAPFTFSECTPREKKTC